MSRNQREITLPEDILDARFGTKNRSELILRTENIKKSVAAIIWMARRYASGRLTYAPELFNDAYDTLRSQLGEDIDPINAQDAEGIQYRDITIEHTKVHPYAIYGENLESQNNRDLKNRKFYPKKREVITATPEVIKELGVEDLVAKSFCCNENVQTHYGDEGTNYYYCSKCKKPCDPR